MYGTRILKRQIGSDARQLENTINRDLVRPFIELNFGPQENYPRFMIPVKEPEDIGALANALDKLVPMGLGAEASVIRDKLGLPDPEDDAREWTGLAFGVAKNLIARVFILARFYGPSRGRFRHGHNLYLLAMIGQSFPRSKPRRTGAS